MLIICSGGIGDNVLFSTVVDRFAEIAQPEEPVTVLMRRDAIGSAFLFPTGIILETYDWRRFRRSVGYRWSFCAEMRKRNFRLVVSTDYERHPFVDEIIIAACGTRTWGERARYSEKFDRYHRQNTRYFERLLDFPPQAHRVIRWLNLAKGLSGIDRRYEGILPSGATSDERQDVIVLHPFSSDSRRELPAGRFEFLLDNVPRHFRVVLSCTLADLKSRREWGELVDKYSLEVDMSSLKEKFERFKSIRLLVTVDTCILHLGALAGTDVICLCTDAYRGWSVPYDDSFAVPHVRFHTDPCHLAGCLGNCSFPLESGAFRCLARLPMERVVADMAGILKAVPRV